MTNTDDRLDAPKTKRLLSLKSDYLFRRIFGDADNTFQFYLIHAIRQRCWRGSGRLSAAFGAAAPI